MSGPLVSRPAGDGTVRHNHRHKAPMSRTTINDRTRGLRRMNTFSNDKSSRERFAKLPEGAEG